MRILSLLLLSLLCIFLMQQEIFADNERYTDSNDILSKVIGGFTNKDNTYIDLLLNHRPDENNRRSMILHFCDVMLDNSQKGTLGQSAFNYNNFQYDPKKSIFLYALCGNFDKISGKNYREKFIKDEYFDITKIIQQDITDLNRIWGIPDQNHLDGGSSYHACNPKTSMGDCDFTNFLANIHSIIMNDLSNIKLSTIYGYKYGKEEQDRSKAIQEFAHSYFHDPEHIEDTCNDKSIYYLYPIQQQDGSRNHCSHPETYKYLDEMLKSAATLIKKTQFLDGESIITLSCQDPMANPISCAMSTTGFYFVEGSWKSFQNVVLNEQLFYNLFLGYYQGMINEFINYQPLRLNDIGVSAERDSFESLTILQEQKLSQQAMYQMFRQLSNLYATFPIHIGLLSYYEDLLYMRSRFSSLYTPLHQLYYEFRNAQDCSK